MLKLKKLFGDFFSSCRLASKSSVKHYQDRRAPLQWPLPRRCVRSTEVNSEQGSLSLSNSGPAVTWTFIAGRGHFPLSSRTQQPLYVDFIWLLSIWWHRARLSGEAVVPGLPRKPRNWGTWLCCSGSFCQPQMSLAVLSFRIIRQCFPFWKLCVHSLLYCRLKDGALEGYQLINKLQSCHSVTKVSIDQSANLGPGLLNGNFKRLRENACGTNRPIPVFIYLYLYACV